MELPRTAEGDAIDRILLQWARERPDLDPRPMAVVGRIGRLASVLDTGLRPLFAEEGLGDGDFDVLAALRRSGAPYRLSASQLSRAMMVTSGGATKRVDRLVSAGLVERTVPESDARGRLVELTERGRVVVDQLIGTHWANADRLLHSLDQAERDMLAGLMRKLLTSLEDTAS